MPVPEKVVCVFGSNEPAAGSDAWREAFGVGRRLAELGFAVANGGYGGTMEASARGAREAGGSTIGVTCSVWSSRPNAYIEHAIVTPSLADRLGKLIELGTCGYVVLPGATGTLAELACVWEQMCKKLLPRRPLACMGTFWQPVVDLMAAARPRCAAFVTLCGDLDAMSDLFGAAK
ncbi:MAG: LOG family protein [Planctomycetaceae bacterium]|nr:LOG family protein [Planctomycetaceae bacterium]